MYTQILYRRICPLLGAAILVMIVSPATARECNEATRIETITVPRDYLIVQGVRHDQ